MANPFSAEGTLKTANGDYKIFRLLQLADDGLGDIATLPYSVRVLLEACLRNVDGFVVNEEDVKNLAAWDADNPNPVELPFKPGRVVLQDFTGVPAIVDLAALRSAMVRMGGDPKKINPLVPCDLVIDHSVQVDAVCNSGDGVADQRPRRSSSATASAIEFLQAGASRRSTTSASMPPATGHRAPGQPGVPRQGRVGRHRTASLYPDSPRRHRQPHDHDQRSRRRRLGSRWDRSRSRDARTTNLHAHAGSRGLQTDRRTPRRGDRHRPRAHGDANAPGSMAWWVSSSSSIGPGSGSNGTGRPGHAGEHGARIRGHDGLLPRG